MPKSKFSPAAASVASELLGAGVKILARAQAALTASALEDLGDLGEELSKRTRRAAGRVRARIEHDRFTRKDDE